jgi:hypothetical protein
MAISKLFFPSFFSQKLGHSSRQNLVPRFYIGNKNSIKMGVDEPYSDNVTHVMLNKNTITIESIDKG